MASDREEFDVYPIHHRNRVFDVITPMDLTFVEVRALLDVLIERGSFEAVEAAAADDDGSIDDDPGDIITVEAAGALYTVDVNGFEVVVFRKD